jgi:hypothetical protein
MESPEDIEKALCRLMPAAISEEGKRSLDELIDGLASGETVVEMTPRKSAWPWLGGIGAAAAAMVIALNLPAGSPAPVKMADTPPTVAAEEGIVLIQQTERVENAEPDGWMSETDGVAHRAWRVRVVDEERLRDLETGYEVLVSRPREEVILMPVTAF